MKSSIQTILFPVVSWSLADNRREDDMHDWLLQTHAFARFILPGLTVASAAVVLVFAELERFRNDRPARSMRGAQVAKPRTKI
jgi:hypothetical protein